MVSIYPSQTIFIKDPRANPGKNVLIIAGNTENDPFSFFSGVKFNDPLALPMVLILETGVWCNAFILDFSMAGLRYLSKMGTTPLLVGSDRLGCYQLYPIFFLKFGFIFDDFLSCCLEDQRKIINNDQK